MPTGPLAVLLLVSGLPVGAAHGVPGGATVIEANLAVSPLGWAVLGRKLLETMSEAAIRYAAGHVRRGGTLIWRHEGGARLDDLPEAFYNFNFPLL